MSVSESLDEYPAAAIVTAEPCVAAAELSEAPRLVTRGETQEPAEDASAGLALIDWLGFSVRPPLAHDRFWLEGALETTFCVPREGWAGTGRGWFGFKHRVDLGIFGLLAYGGDAQRGKLHAELNAHACRQIRDWNAVRLWGEVYGATITRVDLAHDDFGGTALSIERALQWWGDSLFSTNGRPPRSEFVDDMGSNRGKTLYVGRRGSGKLLRVYEKGKQQGDPSSPWTRAEVELHNKGRVVPWDVVSVPGKYLAGAYPALAFLSGEQSRLRTTQRAAEINYDAMVKHLRTQGGKSLNVMCRRHQGDATAVLAQLVRDGVPRRLAGYEDVLGQLEASDGPDA